MPSENTSVKITLPTTPLIGLGTTAYAFFLDPHYQEIAGQADRAIASGATGIACMLGTWGLGLVVGLVGGAFTVGAAAADRSGAAIAGGCLTALALIASPVAGTWGGYNFAQDRLTPSGAHYTRPAPAVEAAPVTVQP